MAEILNGIKNYTKEMWLFLRRWVRQPRLMGAIAPSSLALARKMAQAACNVMTPGDYVLELGAGTGRFTQALLDSGIPKNRLICLEIDDTLAQYLSNKFQGVLVIRGSACFLEDLLPAEIQGKVGAVVSGLPMLNLPLITQEQILQGVFSALTPRGALIQFTYSPLSSIKSAHVALNKKRVGFVLGNIPPATIWEYRQQSAYS